MQVHIETHTHTHTETYPARKPGRPSVRIERYSVEVTINGQRRAVSCSPVWNDHIDVYGLAVRFPTGDKVWPGAATYWLESGNVNNLRPNIDKRTANRCSLVGFEADFADKPVRSQHNAVA